MMKNPPHPGEMLCADVLLPLGLAVTEAAGRLGMSRAALYDRLARWPELAGAA